MSVPVGVPAGIRAMQSRLDLRAGPWRTINMRRCIVGALALALVPSLLVELGPGRYVTQLLLTVLVFAVVTQAWNLVLGVSGIFSIAQLVFYAVGGYTSALVVQELGLSPWVGMPIGAIAAAGAAVLIGAPVLRLRGIYVVLLTLGMNELVRNYIQTGPEIMGRGQGLRTVGLFGEAPTIDPLILHFVAAVGLFFGATYVIWRIIYSPIGMAFTALRDSETYAASRGINQYRFRMLLFVVSAFLTGWAGAFMAHYQGLISPAVLDFNFLITLQTMIVVGGWGTFAGPILGAFVVVGLREMVQPLGAGFTSVATGGLLALIVVTAPRGLLPILTNYITRAIETYRSWE